MKNTFLIIMFLITAISVYGQSNDTVSLDEAIRNAAQQIQNSIGRGSKILVYQFISHDTRVSNYVLKELYILLDNSRRFEVVDRNSREVSDAEIKYQQPRAERINDENLASITSQIGAQVSVTGELVDLGDEYRFWINVTKVEEAAGAGSSYAVSIPKNDRRIRPPNAGDKIGTGALNILFGLGSYLDRDIAGGITITAGYAAAAGLFVIEAAALDWNSPAVGVPATIGVAVAGATFIYGFVRPFIYNRSQRLAAIIDNTQFGIIQISNAGNVNLGVQLSYTFSF